MGPPTRRRCPREGREITVGIEAAVERVVADLVARARMVAGPHDLRQIATIASKDERMPAIRQVMQSPRPLVVLAEKVEGAVLGMLIQNTAHGTLRLRSSPARLLAPPLIRAGA